jgi:hypothetical protein
MPFRKTAEMFAEECFDPITARESQPQAFTFSNWSAELGCSSLPHISVVFGYQRQN